MKLYAPKYYKKFKCIADKCKHTCCAGWVIDIDEETMEKYRKCNHPYGKTILESIEMIDTPSFKLTDKERCPHLNKKGLCEIILNLGEGYICHICREHPRFYNDVSDGKEVGLGMACEEAARIILTSDDYAELVLLEEDSEPFEEIPFDVSLKRKLLYDILSDSSSEYSEKLEKIYETFSVSPFCISDDGWKNVINELEYLDEEHKTMFLKYSSYITVESRYESYLKRTLAYFIYRHCTQVQDEFEFSESLGFCLFCERLFASLLKSEREVNLENVIIFARIISEELEYSEDNTERIKWEFC